MTPLPLAMTIGCPSPSAFLGFLQVLGFVALVTGWEWHVGRLHRQMRDEG